MESPRNNPSPEAISLNAFRAWARRFLAAAFERERREDAFYASGQGDPSLAEDHLDARWERVLRRWRAKAGSGAPPLENASDP